MHQWKAERMDALHPNYFTQLGEKIAAIEAKGKQVIRLDIGSPDLPPPSEIIARMQAELEGDGNHGYRSHRGTPALRRAWAKHYRRHHGVNLDPKRQILPLIGSKEGIFHLSTVLVDPGDLVLLPDPGYQTYGAGARFCGGISRALSCSSGKGYLQALARLPGDTLRRAKMMWANFPHNPTGATVELPQLREMVSLAREHDLLLCHDAAYTQVTYDGYRAPSVLEVEGAAEVALEFNSLSKSHNMAGWRMGVVVGNPAVIERLFLLKTHADSGHFYPMQEAGAAALTGRQTWIKARNARYQKRRDLVIEALQGMGIEIDPPRGGIYVWFPVPDLIPCTAWAQLLLDRVQVALTPGTVFGANGEGYLRLSLTSPGDRLQQGMGRLSRGFSDILEG